MTLEDVGDVFNNISTVSGHAVVGHDPLVAINFTVGSSLAASFISHMSYREGDFLVTDLRASQST